MSVIKFISHTTGNFALNGTVHVMMDDVSGKYSERNDQEIRSAVFFFLLIAAPNGIRTEKKINVMLQEVWRGADHIT